jgi:hypothetical protein
VQYGRARISHPGYVEVVDTIFRTKTQPVCMTAF